MVDAVSEIAALRAALATAEARAETAESRAAAIAAEAAHAKAVLSGSEALIAYLRLEIEKLRRELYGQRSERKQRLLDQLELQLEEMEATASEDEGLAEAAAARAKTEVAAFSRRKPARKPFPEHLPRERVVLPAPCACAACGSGRLAKMGEDVTETHGGHSPPVEGDPDRPREVHLSRLRAHQPAARALPPDAARLGRPRPAGDDRVREVRTASTAEPPGRTLRPGRRGSEPVDARGPGRRRRRRARAAARADRGACAERRAAPRRRHHRAICSARGKTETARLWTYVRDDRPFGGPAPPAALFHFSRDRRGEHPQKHLARWRGILQADAYAGFNALFGAVRKPGPILPAFCWSHARRKFFELADIAANARRGRKAPPISPLALEAVTRIDAVFDLERAACGLPADRRLGPSARQRSRPSSPPCATG